MPSDSDVAVIVSDVSKCYRLFSRPQDRLKQGFWKKRKYCREFWALNGVSFAVGKGETVGIMGRNGSGKSTLLQIIAGTTTPTTGSVKRSGRVAALLELGTGFNPDFTGRENVFVNGAILGLSKAGIKERFEEIVGFAEIGDFIDQPVRTYSSGMIVRLAFSVQAVVPKDILIIDEVLAIGDEAFQRKCFGKIEEFRRQGGTILLVSHDANLVVQLCDRAVLFDQGEMLIQGRTKSVVHVYQRLLYAPSSVSVNIRHEIQELSFKSGWEEGQPGVAAGSRDATSTTVRAKLPGRSGRIAGYDPNMVPKSTIRYEPKGARILDPELCLPTGIRVNLLRFGDEYVWRYRVAFDQACRDVRFGMLIKTTSGLELGGAASAPPGKGIKEIPQGMVAAVGFRFRANLYPGTYFLNAGLVANLDGQESYFDRWLDAAMFKVLPEEDLLMTGLVDFSIEPEVNLTASELLLGTLSPTAE